MSNDKGPCKNCNGGTHACKNCNGTGRFKDDPKYACNYCKGTRVQTCLYCKGTGRQQ